jgi:hypothetical protein
MQLSHFYHYFYLTLFSYHDIHSCDPYYMVIGLL